MQIYYKCKKCGSINEKTKEIKAFKCKSCGLSQLAKERVNEGSEAIISSENPEMQEAQTGETTEAKDVVFKVENVNVEVPKLEEKKGIEPTTAVLPKEQTPSSTKGFEQATTSKYFKTIDAMMKSKDEKWDVKPEEEEMLGAVWCDYANEKFKAVSAEKSKLVVAVASTVTVYLPRIAFYLKRLYDMKQRKRGEKKKDEKEEETEQKYDEPVQEKEIIDDWSKRKPIGI